MTKYNITNVSAECMPATEREVRISVERWRVGNQNKRMFVSRSAALSRHEMFEITV